MRFVPLANKYLEQNLLLFEVESKLYFKSCQFIAPKHQLKVGYSKEYAEKYNLTVLIPDECEKIKIHEKQNPWPCFECSERFTTSDRLQEHLNVHDSEPAPAIPTETSKRSEASVSEPSMGSPNKKQRLSTGAVRKRKLVRSKLSSRKTSGPTVRYACCYCTKVFSKFKSYKKHTEMAHSIDIDTKRMGPPIQANGLKLSKDTNKENSSKWFVCYLCQRYFTTPERLEKHRLLHCNKTDTKSVQCQYCPKRVLTPSALTMHMKTHNTKNGFFRCPFCSERYQNTLLFKDHVKTHMEDGVYYCPFCKKDFKKYIAIRKHIRLNHSSVRYTCQDCGKDFKSKYKLKEHRLR